MVFNFFFTLAKGYIFVCVFSFITDDLKHDKITVSAVQPLDELLYTSRLMCFTQQFQLFFQYSPPAGRA